MRLFAVFEWRYHVANTDTTQEGSAVRSLIRIVLVVCLAGFAFGCATPGGVIPPKVNLVGLVPEGGNLFEQRFRVDLRVSNANNFDIPLDGMSFEMAVNGAHFATGLSNEAVTIPRLGSAVVVVKATAGSADLFRNLLIVAQQGRIDYRIKGTALIGGTVQDTVPFERDGKLSLIPDASGRDRFAPESERGV